MGILNLNRVEIGQVGVKPGTIKMISTDNLATVTAAGYLNEVGNQLTTLNISPSDIVECIYSFNQSTGSGSFTLLTVSISGGVITLSASSWAQTLANGNIFVGNASNLAAAVTMSGDATIINTGELTIANNAVTTAKINAAAVTLAKLATGIAPSHVIKFASQLTTVGGAATEAFTVTGAAATDLAFVQIVNNGTGNVTALEAVVTNNTLTITFSGNPGNDCVFNYQIIRAAT